MKIIYFAIITMLFVCTNSFAQDTKSPPPPENRQVFFGEQHLHTQNSPDAYSMGTRNTPDDAYNFAKGKAIKKNTSGDIVQKKTPYDWAALTDHAEYLGVFPQLSDPNSQLMKELKDNPIVKDILSGDSKRMDHAFGVIALGLTTNNPDPDFNKSSITKSAWQNQIKEKTYIKLREVALTYNFTPKLLDKTFLNTASVSFIGRNLFYWTKDDFYGDLDTYTLTQGDTCLQLPSQRTYGVNLNVSF